MYLQQIYELYVYANTVSNIEASKASVLLKCPSMFN
jgi:hypothetical protein